MTEPGAPSSPVRGTAASSAALLELALSLADQFGVEHASVALARGSGGRLGVRVDLREAWARSGRFEGVALDEGRLYVEGLDPAALAGGASPRELLAGVTVRVERLLVRVSASLANRLFESPAFQAELRRKLPVEVDNLHLNFSMDRMSLEGQVRKGMTFPFTVELFLEAVDNRFRVVFENFWAGNLIPLPGFVRRLLISAARSVVARDPKMARLATMTDDYVLLDPWPAVPLKLEAELTRFGVEGSHLVIELGAPRAAAAPGPSVASGASASPSPSSPVASRPVPAAAPSPVSGSPVAAPPTPAAPPPASPATVPPLPAGHPASAGATRPASPPASAVLPATARSAAAPSGAARQDAPSGTAHDPGSREGAPPVAGPSPTRLSAPGPTVEARGAGTNEFQGTEPGV